MQNNNMQNTNRIIRIININPYLNNMAKFNWSIYFSSILFIAITIFSSIIFTIYFFESLDYLKALNEVQASLIRIGMYFFTNFIGFLNNLEFIDEFLKTNLFNINIKLQSPDISYQGWFIIILSSVIAVLFHILSLYQYYVQKLFKTSGFFNYYIPYFLLHKFYSRIKNNKVYIKILPLVRLEKINKTDYHLLIQNFFNINLEDIQNYELKIEAKRFLYWYDYQILHLTKVESKSKKDNSNDNKEKISTNKQNSEQNKKIPSNTKKLKGFFE